MNIKFFASLWLSRVIFKVLNQECKKLYRKLERTSIKQISATAHQSFNETCLNNKQLPPYTNIYINIYLQTKDNSAGYISSKRGTYIPSCTNFIRISEQIRDVTWCGDVIIENFIENDRVYRKNKIKNKPWRLKYHTWAYCSLIRCIYSVKYICLSYKMRFWTFKRK